MDCSNRDQLCVLVRYMCIIHSEPRSISAGIHLSDPSKASFTEAGISMEFNVSKEVTVLGLSLFVMGLGLGPLLVGPLSEVYGRNVVYQVSYLLFFIFSWPIAFAPNIGMSTFWIVRGWIVDWRYMRGRSVVGISIRHRILWLRISLCSRWKCEWYVLWCHCCKVSLCHTLWSSLQLITTSPMAVYTLSPFLGPIIGPIFSSYVPLTTTWYADKV
jgi:MFS family permease